MLASKLGKRGKQEWARNHPLIFPQTAAFSSSALVLWALLLLGYATVSAAVAVVLLYCSLKMLPRQLLRL
jgi:hypothetical protein